MKSANERNAKDNMPVNNDWLQEWMISTSQYKICIKYLWQGEACDLDMSKEKMQATIGHKNRYYQPSN